MANPIMSTYGRLPIRFTHGEGAWLWDQKGKKYLDALSGVAVCGLGHAHPVVREAICKQAATLIHTSNLYEIEKQIDLAHRLLHASGMDSAFFANSGAEANEAALKIARLYGNNKGIKQPAIVVMDHSFHGRTLATLSATGNRKIQAGFEPLVQGFVRSTYNDPASLANIGENSPNVVAVMLEPIQGEGGINIPDATYLPAIRTLCDRHGWLMILDEIQTGMGRTGKMFAYQHQEGLLPDVLTLAKALGNGVPISACLARGIAAKTFAPGQHGSTFGGNPLACAAALAVLDVLEKENLPARAKQLGQRIVSGIQTAVQDLDVIKEIRFKGLMIGIELNQPCHELIALALAQGLLINVTARNVIRLLPPLILSDVQADQIVAILGPVIRSWQAS